MEGLQTDELKMYLGTPINIANGVTVYIPKIGEIAEFGETRYFSAVSTICSTPSENKVLLDDLGYDFSKVSDFEMFKIIYKGLPNDTTRLSLGDLDFQSLSVRERRETGEKVLINDDGSIIIDEIVYDMMTEYIRKIHNFKKKVEKPGNAITRRILIDDARKEAERNKGKPQKSFLTPLISAVKCKQKYTIDYVKNMNVFEFMSDIERISAIDHANALTNGRYCGMADLSKVSSYLYDWTRDLSADEKQAPNTVLKEGAN